MLLVFTGNGKGKTTMALGQAMRTVGAGKKVLMVQFIKGPWHSGEEIAAERFGEQFELIKTGKGFVGILGDRLPFREHVAAAQAGLKQALAKLRKAKRDMLILDEINNAMSLHLLEWSEVEQFLDAASSLVETIICTGRDAPAELVSRAELVTAMEEIKHPYQLGVKAKVGVEF